MLVINDTTRALIIYIFLKLVGMSPAVIHQQKQLMLDWLFLGLLDHGKESARFFFFKKKT